MTEHFEAASAHGRFQPIHNGHLEYLLAAKARCRYLWVGITAYELDVSRLRSTDRERPENNPLTYFERVRLITLALLDAGVKGSDFGFLPFPIEAPDKLPNFLPLRIPCFTTICEPWNREKIGILERIGYKVVVLYERKEKSVTGKMVRNNIQAGGKEWEVLVPRAVIGEIINLDLARRLRELGAGHSE